MPKTGCLQILALFKLSGTAKIPGARALIERTYFGI
jgi:hypothetical protein